MIELPNACIVNKVVPKKIFYDKIQVSTSLKKEFVEKVDKIYWKYKISEDNLNISKTSNVEEIEVFQIILKEKYNTKNILNFITKAIPYPILFEIVCNNEFVYAIQYDNDIIYSNLNEDIRFEIDGLDLGIVYENIVRQVGNIVDNKTELKQEIEKQKSITELEKEIKALRNKIIQEKQFNRKVELNQKLRKLEKEMEELNNG